jgi:hypothetical protein
MCDLDNMGFKQVKSLAFKALKLFRLEGFIILKSSQGITMWFLISLKDGVASRRYSFYRD